MKYKTRQIYIYIDILSFLHVMLVVVRGTVWVTLTLVCRHFDLQNERLSQNFKKKYFCDKRGVSFQFTNVFDKMFCNNEEIYVNDQSCATMTSTDNLTYKDCQCFRISILRFVCLLWFLCHDDGVKWVVLIKCDLLRPPIQEARALFSQMTIPLRIVFLNQILEHIFFNSYL